ncbi:membrane protein insertase YidC [Geotalea uraniireducens]|uniref:Membrane protein insertase YidC n=1 Tax=Geotalea uraniireducens (strain Rf4) TaxID=351605 RepID=YIDC_GEOUR|nr:membrane protein insertase YidC [Geotalea uraniireducens]A5G9V4.1 RecName: Full=Membrane protein insertase YidC; AltName: Full=Foldase YidC; AltName: Full=Membrane integrase YidC; AltName: Full=Membrane protein YidC [Geotalea uraniireducens Rf4]ABQ28572.1 protein translocase subunit yidC [Geotalea uraniireducens Rf4]
MEKRVVIAVILSIAVLYAYSMIFPPPQKKDVVKPGPVPQSQTAPVQAVSSTSVLPAIMQQGNVSVRDLVVETDLFTAVFSTRGAGLKKLVLKRYKETSGPGGREVVLVNEEAAEKFSLLTEGKSFGIEPTVVYNSISNGLKLAGNEKGTLEFTSTSPTGIVFKKSYIFTGNDYRIDLHQELLNNSPTKFDGSLHLIGNNRIEAKPGDGRFEVYGPVTLADDKINTEKVADFSKGPKQYDKNILWTAFADKYFMNAILSDNNSIAAVRLAKVNTNYLQDDVSSPPLALNPGQSAAVNYRIFYGPKDLEILKGQGSRLEEAIDFGWFSALAKPLLRTLKFFYSYTHNYGIAIIIITVILKLLFFPLTHKSYKSMKEMQKLQPKMAELKEKFKNDRDAMNRAVMDLYKTHKVNPMGGCLPMIVQIPVFFALYKALMFSIELRHAPFMLWIMDLSAKDPYYVTPVIMGVTMFVQQKMTPSNMDPVQAKMMLALPVVFTFMFLNFPSGLVLYWLVNNILTIAQQTYINKSLPS